MKYYARNYINFSLFLAIGLWIFLFGGYLSTLPIGIRTTIKVFNPLVLGIAVLVCSHQQRWKIYFPVAFAYFLGASGLLLAWFFREWPLVVLVADMNTLRSWALAKLFEALPMILPALVLLPLAKMSYADVYFHRGRLGLGLLLGLGMCILVWLVYGLTSDVFPKLWSMLPVLGWVLLFSVTNAFMEEFILRGLFLRPFENFFSPVMALFLTTLIFTGMHFGANYLTSDNLLMLLVYIFLLGFGNGAIMQRSNSIWGGSVVTQFR